MTNIIDLTKTSGAKPVTSIESPLGGTPQPAPEVDASEANLESCINTRRAELIFFFGSATIAVIYLSGSARRSTAS